MARLLTSAALLLLTTPLVAAPVLFVASMRDGKLPEQVSPP
jgi:hypothetical protein